LSRGLDLSDVSLRSGQIFSRGPPVVDVVNVPLAPTGSSSTTTQCAGNVVRGISRIINFSYFVRFRSDAGSSSTITPPSTMAYIIDTVSGVMVASANVTALLPRTVSEAFVEVKATFKGPERSLKLDPSRAYWLPFCFTVVGASGSSSVPQRRSGSTTSVGLGGSGSSSSTVMTCSGGPSCTPSLVEQGSLSTAISSASSDEINTSSGDGGLPVIVAAAVVPAVLIVVAAVAAGVAFYVWRSQGRLQLPHSLRRRTSQMSDLPPLDTPMFDRSMMVQQVNDMYVPHTQGFK
jgi:hypothetical protein